MTVTHVTCAYEERALERVGRDSKLNARAHPPPPLSSPQRLPRRRLLFIPTCSFLPNCATRVFYLGIFFCDPDKRLVRLEQISGGQHYLLVRVASPKQILSNGRIVVACTGLGVHPVWHPWRNTRKTHRSRHC